MPFSFRAQFGGNDQWLAVSDQTGRLRIVDITTGRTARVIELNPGSPFAAHPTRDLVIRPIGLTLAAINVQDGGEVWKAQLPEAPKNKLQILTGMQVSSDGSTVTAVMMLLDTRGRGTNQFRVFRWDANKGALLQESAANSVESVQRDGISADGEWLHSSPQADKLSRPILRAGGRDPGIVIVSHVVNLRTGQRVGVPVDGQIAASHSGVRRVVFSRDSDPSQSVMALMDVDTGRQLGSWPGHSASFTPDGKSLLVTGQYPNWVVVDTATGKVLATAKPDMPHGIAWAIARSGKSIATYQQDSLILASVTDPGKTLVLGGSSQLATTGALVEAEAARKRGEPVKTSEIVDRLTVKTAVAMVPGSRWMAVRGADGWIDLWDTATGDRLPFRHPPPKSNDSLLVARLATRSRQNGAGQWLPVSIIAPNPPTAFTSARLSDWTCRSENRRFSIENSIDAQGSPVATLKDLDTGRNLRDLKVLGADFSSGCSISPDGTRAVVTALPVSSRQPGSLIVPRGPSLRGSQSLSFQSGRPLLVLDVVRGVVISQLQTVEGAAGKLPFPASSVRWSSDGAFLVGPSTAQTMSAKMPVYVWRADTGQPLSLPGLSSGHSLQPAAGEGPYLEASEGSNGILGAPARIQLWDLHAEPRSVYLAGAQGNIAIAPGGKTAIGPNQSGTLSVWHLEDGRELGQMKVMESGNWLVTTSSGLFDGSPGGWAQLVWRVSDKQLVTSSGEIYFNEFYRPGLLAHLLNGVVPQPVKAITQIDRRQPSVTLSAQLLDDRTGRVKIQVKESRDSGSGTGSGARDLRLFRNGSLVKAWRGDLQLDASGTTTIEADLAIVAGENRITAYAFNRDNIKSTDAQTTLVSRAAPKKGRAFVLAIGVNKYANQDFNLNYAVADAQSLTTELTRTQQQIPDVGEVRTVVLRDDEATRDNILYALDRLAGKQEGPIPSGRPAILTSLERLTPGDTLFVSFSGHGISYADHFYLIPYDLAYQGPREKVGQALPQVVARGISDADLEGAFEAIDARHIALIIDACQSGQAIESADARQGPMNSRGLAQLAYEKGMHILAASQPYQAALESSTYGHGVLTYALVEEGLKTAAADTAPNDGQTTGPEWFAHAARRVPELEWEALARTQAESRVLTFSVGQPPMPAGGLQTPRFFTRREVVGPELVVVRH